MARLTSIRRICRLAPAVEEFLPESLYVRAGRLKADDLATIERIKNDKPALRTFKAELSLALAAELQLEDVEGAAVAEALEAAAGRAEPRGP